MRLHPLLAKLAFWITRFLIGMWSFIRWTNLLALGAGRFHTSWVQGIGAAIFCTMWIYTIIMVFLLNDELQIDPAELGRLNWNDWLFLPIISFLATNLGCIAIGRFLVSKAKVAALLAANDLPADSSIYKLDFRYGPALWLFCYFFGIVALMAAFSFLGIVLGIVPPPP